MRVPIVIPELRGQQPLHDGRRSVAAQAHTTVTALLGGEDAATKPSRVEELLEKLLWAVPGDGYKRVSIDLSTARNMVVIFDARGRGRAMTVLRADSDQWELLIEGGDSIPGDELPVGSVFELRGFHRVYVSNPAGVAGQRLTILFETTSLGG